jgi:AcrR family transcriptional regulator
LTSVPHAPRTKKTAAVRADRPRVARAKRRRPGRPPADQPNLRERLLDAAIECFTTSGIAAASLRSIAVTAGVTPAMVHYYFGSKEKLLDAFLAERLVPRVAELAASVRSAGDEPRALVAAFVRGLHAIVQRNPWWPSLWFREVLGENGALRDFIVEQISAQVPLVLAKRFAALQKEGAIPADVDPRLLVVSLVGLTMFPLAAQPIWRRVFDARDIDIAALERHTLALLDHGFGGTRAH